MCFVLINFISIIKAWSDNTDKSEGYYFTSILSRTAYGKINL